MKIIVIKNKKKYFIQNKIRNTAPLITPFEDRAWDFKNLHTCKGIRDDVLEYFPKNAIIVG